MSDDLIAAGTTSIDPWLAREYTRVIGIDNPLYCDGSQARAAGYREVLLPETQVFLPTRVGDDWRDPSAAALADGGNFEGVVTRIRTEFFRPVESGQPFTVRVRRGLAPAAPTERVATFHSFIYELTDVNGEIAMRQELTVAEFRK